MAVDFVLALEYLLAVLELENPSDSNTFKPSSSKTDGDIDCEGHYNFCCDYFIFI